MAVASRKSVATIFILMLLVCITRGSSSSDDIAMPVLASEVQTKLKHEVKNIIVDDGADTALVALYPGMLDAQLVSNDHFKFIRCVSQDDNYFHVDTHMKTPDDVFVGLDIKYLNDCSYRLDPSFQAGKFLHPLAYEYAFLKALEGKGLAPKAYLLSPPTPDSGALKQAYFHRSGVKHMIERRFPFLNLPNPEKCEKVVATTRFMAYEDIGISVYTFFDFNSHRFKSEVERLRSIINLGIKVLDLVDQLHRHGVVHGNINGGSIRSYENRADWSSYSESSSTLILVDFHEAFTILDPAPIGNYNHVDAPPWHLGGGVKRGKRDDVYAVAELLARLISDGGLNEQLMLADSEKHIAGIRHVKDTYELFPNKGLLYFLGLGSERFRVADEFMKTIRGMEEDCDPPYGELLGHLGKMRDILSKEGNGILAYLFG